MKLIIPIFFAFSFLFGGCSNSDNVLQNTNVSEEKSSFVWIRGYIPEREITFKPTNSKNTHTFIEQNLVEQIISAINQSNTTKMPKEKGTFLGTVDIDQFGVIEVYHSKEKQFIYLISDKGVKEIGVTEFKKAIKSHIRAEPIPPGTEPGVISPLPPGKGFGFKNLEPL